MSEDADGVLLTDGRSCILLHLPERYPDGHGFHHLVDLVGGPFRGSIDASSYEGCEAYRGFRDGLVALYKSLQGEARLPISYENLDVSLIGDGRGHIRVHVHAVAGHTMDIKLSFNFGIDQTHLPAIIKAVERVFIRDGTSIL